MQCKSQKLHFVMKRFPQYQVGNSNTKNSTQMGFLNLLLSSSNENDLNFSYIDILSSKEHPDSGINILWLYDLSMESRFKCFVIFSFAFFQTKN